MLCIVLVVHQAHEKMLAFEETGAAREQIQPHGASVHLMRLTQHEITSYSLSLAHEVYIWSGLLLTNASPPLS